MKKLLWIVIVLLVAVLMAVTAPAEEKHKEAMMKAVREYVDEEAAKRGFGDNVLSNLGKGIVNKTVEVALNSKLHVNNYLIFNTTHVKLDGKKKTLSLGLLGHVFTFDKKMLRDALEASAQEKQELREEHQVAKQAAREARKLKRKLRREQRRNRRR